jgi:hypothetical protein
MDLSTILAGAGTGIAMGATLLLGARYMIRAELATLTSDLIKELNGKYVKSGECELVQKLREQQFKNIDDRIDLSKGL